MTRRMGMVGGFVAALLTLATSAEAVTKVNVDVLNVRTGPGTGYRVIGTLSRGTIVKVVSRSGSWTKISSPKTGWCYSSYLKTVTTTTTSSSVLSLSHWGAPPSDYRRVYFRGVTVNIRTRVMVERAEAIMRALGGPSRYSFIQGSYHYGVSASAGTHNGGGAIDVRCSYYSTYTADTKLVKALRMAGFAAWRRRWSDGFSPHIHAIAIGDRQASSGAKYQVYEYFRGGDGLSGYRRDVHLTSEGHNIGRPVPNWAR